MLKIKVAKGVWFLFNRFAVISVLKRSRLFDSVFYVARNPLQVPTMKRSYFHFTRIGAWHGRSPHPLFDCNYYLAQVPWCRKYRVNPLWHYIVGGHYRGLNPHPLFDTQFVRGRLPWYARWRNPLVAYLKSESLWEGKTHPYFTMENFVSDIHAPTKRDVSPLSWFSFRHLASVRRKIIFDCEEKIRKALRTKNIKQLLGYYDLMSGLEPFFHDNFSEQRMLNWKTMRAHANEQGIVAKTAPPREIAVAPVRIRSREGKVLAGGKQELPAPYLSHLRNVEFITGTRYVIQGDQLLHDELPFYPQREYEPKYGGLKYINEETALIKFMQQWGKKIPAAILVSAEHDANYFHWMIEVLPKVLFADQAGIPPEVPFLVDVQLHENFLLMLKALSSRPLMRVVRHQLMAASELYYVSDFSRLLDRYTGDMKVADCVIDRDRVRDVRDRLAKSFGLTYTEKPFRKIYFLRRRNSLRKIYGEEKLLDAILPLGYEPIVIEELPLKFQFQLMSQASHVLGPTGAAFANILFCHPETKVTILNSLHPLANLYVYNQLGQAVDLDVEFVLGKTASVLGGKFGLHDDYEIDLELVLEAIRR